MNYNLCIFRIIHTTCSIFQHIRICIWVKKTIVFAILKEKDSMYYYMDKEKEASNILEINGAIEVDPYRKEERYKTFLKKNYLPLTQWNE